MHSDITPEGTHGGALGFKSGKYDILVATDAAARGIDISGVTHVINYRVPENAGRLCAPHRPYRPRGSFPGMRSRS